MRNFSIFSAVLRITALMSLLMAVGCNNSSSLKGSGPQGKNQGDLGNGGDEGRPPDEKGDHDQDGEHGEGEGRGAGGRGDSDLANTGFDRRDQLPDGTVRLVKKGESTKSTLPVDIVFALDTSGSMDAEKVALKATIPEFFRKLDSLGKDLDYRVWMIADDAQFFSAGNPKAELVNVMVGSFDALQRFNEFVTGQGAFATQVKTKLRDQSQKHFVVVTDDNAANFVAADFITLATTNPLLKNRTSVSGVIGLSTTITPANINCNIANVGAEYQRLAGTIPLATGQQSPLTKGLILDLCAPDWTTKLVDALGTKVIAESLRREFPLPEEAKAASKMLVSIGGKQLPSTAYTYDKGQNAIIFTADTAPKVGDELVVSYIPKSSS